MINRVWLQGNRVRYRGSVPAVFFHDVVVHFDELPVHPQDRGMHGANDHSHHFVHQHGLRIDEAFEFIAVERDHFRFPGGA